jgi:hypothetical protein
MMLRSTRAASQLLQRLLRHAAASSETAAALWPQQQQQQQHTTNDTTPLLLAGWPLGLWQGSDASSRPASLAACVRGLASVSTPALHAGCGHNHDHDHGCVDAVTTQIRATQDMQQLQQLVQQGSGRFTASQAAAAYRQAATLAGSSPAAAAPVVGLLAPAWPALLPQASGSDLAWTLLAWTKLHLGDERLWAATLAAVPGQVPTAAGQDLANICYALAATSEANGGSVPGVPQAQVCRLPGSAPGTLSPNKLASAAGCSAWCMCD